jgi:putative SOS response-associated peptidase YedK
MDISEGLSRVSWKLSRTVLRGGAAANGGSLLDQHTTGVKQPQPWYFTRHDGQPITFAAVHDMWTNPETKEPLRSCSMVIREPNKFVAEIHDRMPVILEAEDFEQWEHGDAKDAAALMKPAGQDVLQRWPLSKRVNSSRSDDSDATLIEKIELG